MPELETTQGLAVLLCSGMGLTARTQSLAEMAFGFGVFNLGILVFLASEGVSLGPLGLLVLSPLCWCSRLLT